MSKSTCNNFLIYLLFAITILAVIQLIISPFITKLKNREAFQSEIRNEPILKAQLTYEYKPVITIYRRERDNSQKLDALDQSHNNVKIETINNLTELQRLKHPQHLFYTDAFTYNQKYRNFPILTICSSPKQFMLVSNKDQPLLVENNRAILNIGYRTETELELFKKIVKSQNDYVNMNGYKFVELKGNSNNEVITRLFDDKTIDILIVFATISDPLLVKVRERDYTLIAYNDNIDNNVLKYYIPFSKKRIVSNSRNREEESVDSDNNLIFYNTLLIDNLLVITDLEKAEKNSDIRNVWQYLLEYFDEFTKINYYQQFFQFASLSKNWSLKRQETASFQNIFDKPKFVEQNINKNVEHFASTPIKDSRISGTRDGLGLLNFDNSPSSKFMKFKVFPSKVVPLEHTNDLVKFKFEETIINGVPIKVGDKLYTETGLGNFFERKDRKSVV